MNVVALALLGAVVIALLLLTVAPTSVFTRDQWLVLGGAGFQLAGILLAALPDVEHQVSLAWSKFRNALDDLRAAAKARRVRLGRYARSRPNAVANWGRRRLGRPQQIRARLDGNLPFATGSLTAHVRRSGTIDERLQRVEDRLDGMREQWMQDMVNLRDRRIAFRWFGVPLIALGTILLAIAGWPDSTERVEGATLIPGVPLPASHGLYRVVRPASEPSYDVGGIFPGDLLLVDHEITNQDAVARAHNRGEELCWMIFRHAIGAETVGETVAEIVDCGDDEPLILAGMHVGVVTAIIHPSAAVAPLSRPAPTLVDLLEAAGEMWRAWRREHPYVDICGMGAQAARPFEEAHAAAWERVREEVIPTAGATLLALAGDPRLFERVHNVPECSIKGAVGAAVADALLEHWDAIDAEARS